MTVYTGNLPAHLSPPTFTCLRPRFEKYVNGLREYAPLPNVEVYRAKKDAAGNYINEPAEFLRTEKQPPFVCLFNPGSQVK